MDDDQQGVSSVSEPTVGVIDETLMENSGCEDDGGEIMVEVVGSDVFVDGVCGDVGELGQDGSRKELDDSTGQQNDTGIGNGVEGVIGVAGLSGDVCELAGTDTEVLGGVPSISAHHTAVEQVSNEDTEVNTVRSVESIAHADLASVGVAGSSGDVSEVAGIEVLPGVSSVTAHQTVVEQVSNKDAEVNIVRSIESVAHADLASVDGVAGLSGGVSETVDTGAVPGLPSQIDDLEQVSVQVSEEVVQSTASVAPADMTAQRVGTSADGAWNPGIEPPVGSSSLVTQGNPNVEDEEASNQTLGSSEKDEISAREIVGQARDKDVVSHAKDQLLDHPAGGVVSRDSGVVDKAHSEVEMVETRAPDEDRVDLGKGDVNLQQDGGLAEKTCSDVENMETNVHDQEMVVEQGNKQENSHQDGVVEETRSDVENMETDVNDQETVELGNKEENSQQDRVVEKPRSDVENMETDVHDQETVELVNKEEESHQDRVVEKTHSDVENMESDVNDQKTVELRNKEENSHQDRVVEKTDSDVKNMESDVHDQETVKDDHSHQANGVVDKPDSLVEASVTDVCDQVVDGLGNKDENSHRNAEQIETDDYGQDGELLNKNHSNNSHAVVKSSKIFYHDDQASNMCHLVPAGLDCPGVGIPVSQDSASNSTEETVSLKPNSEILVDKVGDVVVVSGDSEISVGQIQGAHDHSLGSEVINLPLHPGKQELSLKENLAVGNGSNGSCEKENHAVVGAFKAEMHEDETGDISLCTEKEVSCMENQNFSHKEVAVDGSEVSSSKIPIPVDEGGVLSGSDTLPMQPKVADGIDEVTHDDGPQSSEQGNTHGIGNIEEMEVDVDRLQVLGTPDFPMNSASLNGVEVSARSENDVRMEPLEILHTPAGSAAGGSLEMDKDGDVQLGTSSTGVRCTADKNMLTDETTVSLEAMMSTGDENHEVTGLLPEDLEGDISLQHVDYETLSPFDDHAGKEGHPKVSAVSSNNDVVDEAPEGTSLSCQHTSEPTDSDTYSGSSHLLFKENDLKVEAEVKVEAKDALGDGPTHEHDLFQDNEKVVATGVHSNTTKESESTANQDGVVEDVHMPSLNMDNAAGTATCAEVLNEENKSSMESSAKSQTATHPATDISPAASDQNGETCISHTSTVKMNQVNAHQDSEKANEDPVVVHASEMKVTDEPGEVQKLRPETPQDSSEQGKGTEELADETNQSMTLNEKSASLLKMRPGYLIPSEKDGEYSISDLVWGKVRSHPWWPGQIFDPSDASEKAMKYRKKDSFLVAYFGDRTFAWNDASVLRPFWSHFSHIEKQSNSETFQNAITCALEEVSRRVELGLCCSCIPESSYDKISCQVVENTGISEESSKRYGVDESTGVSSFRPDLVMHYMKLLALSPTSRPDRLDLAIARAQLVAYCRFKGYRLPPEFLLSGEFLEDDADTPQVGATDDKVHASEDGEQRPTRKVSAHKRKHRSKESSQPKKKERSLSELMDDMECETPPDGEVHTDEKAFTSSKKRKSVDSLTVGSDKRISVNAAKVSTKASVSPRPSFRIGECIQRVASQLTRPAPLVKCNSDQSRADVPPQDSPKEKEILPTELPSPNELLSQLRLVARAPSKGRNFLKTITSFFSDFRKSVISNPYSRRQNSSAGKSGGGRKRKASQTAAGPAEEYEFDDVNDSYWTDRVVRNCGEEQPLQNSQSGEGEPQPTVCDPEKSNKTGRKPYSRKRKPIADVVVTPGVPPEEIEKRKNEPAELILNFTDGGPLPSEMNLNKMFRRFGPLKELETEVRQESSRARLVFKRGSDAEVAHNSVQTFKIFGSRHVTYELSYTPVISFKPLLLTPDLEGAV